jgi:hypothetical protein
MKNSPKHVENFQKFKSIYGDLKKTNPTPVVLFLGPPGCGKKGFQFDDIEKEIHHLISFLKSEGCKFYQIYYGAFKKSGFSFEINKKSIKNYLPEIEKVELIFEKI